MILGIILAIFIVLYITKRGVRRLLKKKIYQPKRRHIKLRGIEYRDLYLNVNNGRYYQGITPTAEMTTSHENYINVWYLHRYPGAKIVLYFHGNSYNISYRKYMIDICNVLGLNLFLVDYRGYGRSTGKVSPQNILKDAEASYRFLVDNGHDPSTIVIWGESLGGSPACHVYSNYPVHSLILLSTFSSLHSLLPSNGENVLKRGAYWVLRLISEDINQYTDNAKMLSRGTRPVLLFHSRSDRLIPYSNAEMLLEVLPPGTQKRLVEITGDHDSPKISASNFRAITELLELEPVEDDRIDRIVEIIDNLSFTAQSSSSY